MIRFHSFLIAFLFFTSTVFAQIESSDFPKRAVVEALNRILVLQEPFSLEESDLTKIRWARKNLEEEATQPQLESWLNHESPKVRNQAWFFCLERFPAAALTRLHLALNDKAILGFKYGGCTPDYTYNGSILFHWLNEKMAAVDGKPPSIHLTDHQRIQIIETLLIDARVHMGQKNETDIDHDHPVCELLQSWDIPTAYAPHVRWLTDKGYSFGYIALAKMGLEEDVPRFIAALNMENVDPYALLAIKYWPHPMFYSSLVSLHEASLSDDSNFRYWFEELYEALLNYQNQVTQYRLQLAIKFIENEEEPFGDHCSGLGYALSPNSDAMHYFKDILVQLVRSGYFVSYKVWKYLLDTDPEITQSLITHIFQNSDIRENLPFFDEILVLCKESNSDDYLFWINYLLQKTEGYHFETVLDHVIALNDPTSFDILVQRAAWDKTNYEKIRDGLILMDHIRAKAAVPTADPSKK